MAARSVATGCQAWYCFTVRADMFVFGVLGGRQGRRTYAVVGALVHVDSFESHGGRVHVEVDAPQGGAECV